MAVRAVTIWFVLLVIASANGALRQGVLVPQLGDTVGRFISSLALSVFIAVLAWLTIEWIGPRSPGHAWTIGMLWLALTLAFEFLAGYYLFGNPWSQLLEDYNILRGRIWILVLITTLLAPRIAILRNL